MQLSGDEGSKKREQPVQRPWDRGVPGLPEQQRRGQCRWGRERGMGTVGEGLTVNGLRDLCRTSAVTEMRVT